MSLLLPVFLWSPVALALSLSQATPCTTLPFTHTEALSSRAQCRLNEGGGWEGAATGYKGVGWSNRNGGKNWKNYVWAIRRGLMWGFVPLWSSWLHVQGWRLFWAHSDPFFLPPFYCFLPCVRVEQQPVLYADCSVWVLRLWMLAVVMCHVLCILSQSVSSVNTLSECVGFTEWCGCLPSFKYRRPDRCSDLQPALVLPEQMLCIVITEFCTWIFICIVCIANLPNQFLLLCIVCIRIGVRTSTILQFYWSKLSLILLVMFQSASGLL